MSAATGSSTEVVRVYVPLLNEGTDVLRPTTGVPVGPGVVRLEAAADYDPETEEWAFLPGVEVRCATEVRGGERLLVARTAAGG